MNFNPDNNFVGIKTIFGGFCFMKVLVGQRLLTAIQFEKERELRALINFAFHLDLTIHKFNHFPCNR